MTRKAKHGRERSLLEAMLWKKLERFGVYMIDGDDRYEGIVAAMVSAYRVGKRDGAKRVRGR